MQGAREFLDTKPGRISAAVLVLAGSVVLTTSITSYFGNSATQAASINRLFICAESGKPFHYELKKGDSFPVRSPYTGRLTGYPAELCFWTRDGAIKDDPTPVLLNEYKGTAGPTFCLDCGRLVVAHNPAPSSGARPPPTREQFLQKKGVTRDDG